MSTSGDLLQRIDDRTWPALPLDLRWKIVPWAIEAGELAEASRLLDATERERGESVKLIEQRIRLASAQNDDAELRRLLELRADRYPSATALVQLARFLLDHGEGERASDLYDSLRQTHGQQLQVQQLGNAIARAQGDQQAIRAGLERELEGNPNGFWPNLLLATWYLDNGQPDTAYPLLHSLLGQTVELSYESHLMRLAEQIERAGDPAIASDLRARAAELRDKRFAELQAEIEAALEKVESGGSFELDLDDAGRPVLVPVDRHSSDPRSSARSGEAGTKPGATVGAGRSVAPPQPAETTALISASSVDAFDTPLDPAILSVLERDFGHSSLRDGQRQVIERVMAGTDTLAIMPTGAGKSLTFQLPAMLLPGVTIVISPLIALMKDQLESLPRRVRDRSTVINSTLSFDETQRRLDDIRAGAVKLVYIAPERFRDHRFLRALQRVSISLAVIDEAHCINLWGSDFRPDYLFIPKALAELGDPPVLALTATATPRMANEIGAGLGRELDLVRVSLFRSNLFYSVEELKNREEKVTRLVELCRTMQGAGIVYVGSRKDAESLADTLCAQGVQAVPYHAGLDPDTRARNQESFMSGRTRVVVATVAFGMGIDKADVRFIIHFAAPSSLEAYAQESGRAGRDGRGARCILLATANDGTRLRQFARREEIRIDTLRAVYAEIKRAAIGEWTVVDPRRIDLALQSDDPDEQIDTRVALGIIEQAGLITRHPDAPVRYDLTRIMDRSVREAEAVVPDRYRQWIGGLQLPASIETAAACSALGVSPFELDRYLTEDPTLMVRGGNRGIAVHLLPPPPHIAQRIEELLDRARKDSDRRIDLMVGYIQNREGYCRHAMLAAHLGERLAPCGTVCDVCAGKVKPSTARSLKGPTSQPTLADADIVLRAAKSLPYPMGKPGLTRLLSGSTESRLRDDRSEFFGVLQHLSRGSIERLIDTLVEHDYLAFYQEGEYRMLSVTVRGRAGEPVELPGSRIERTTRLAEAPQELDPASDAGKRYARLAEWRREQMEREQKPAFVIASNAQLREMATLIPSTQTELAGVKGFGSARADRYGADILRILA